MDRSPIRTDTAPAPFRGAPYNQAIVAGDLVFVSGQGPLDKGQRPDRRRHRRSGEPLQLVTS